MADNADRAQENDERVMRRFESRPTPVRDLRASTECMECGDEIAPARLKIFPYAIRCAECQGFFEQQRG